MSELSVRVMRPDEYGDMRAVSVAAFADESIGTLLDHLRSSWVWNDDLCFVAERDGEIVAQVLFTHTILDAPKQLVEVLVLSPVGVRPDVHGQGIGSHLIRESLRVVAGRSEPAVFLEGNPVYYERFGFVAGASLGFRKPSLRIPDAAFQVRPQPNFDEALSGTLVYADPFWLTDSVGLR